MAAISNTLGVKLARLGSNLKKQLGSLVRRISVINTLDLIP